MYGLVKDGVLSKCSFGNWTSQPVNREVISECSSYPKIDFGLSFKAPEFIIINAVNGVSLDRIEVNFFAVVL